LISISLIAKTVDQKGERLTETICQKKGFVYIIYFYQSDATMSFDHLCPCEMSMISIILVLSCLLFTKTQSQWAFRQYVIEKDFFTGFKAGEFSVYDQSEKNLLYRLESSYAITQTAQLYAYPGKQMVGSIRNTWSPWGTIFDLKIFNKLK